MFTEYKRCMVPGDLDKLFLTRGKAYQEKGRDRQERALVMELLHRSSGLKQRMIAERFGGLGEGSVSCDRGAVREKIETELKIRKWFLDLTRLST